MKNKNSKDLKTTKALVKLSLVGDKPDPEKITILINKVKKLPKHKALPILRNYFSILKKKIEAKTLLIESPIMLTESEINTIKHKFQSYKTCYLKTITNPNLIAGVKISISDHLWDFSLKERLNKITKFLRD